jgi:glycyl-tRNA synthetase beta chain
MKKAAEQVADFLFEIGCEEIPAGMVAKACAELKVILQKYLETNNLLKEAPIETSGGPRRLAASCAAIRLRQPDVEREVMGPPKSVAYDSVGQPTKAADSFAAKQGIPLEKTYVISTARGEYIAGKQVIKGRSSEAILQELLPRVVAEIPWPRSMYWERRGGARFIRPIRWIVVLLGGKVLPLTIAGVAAGRESEGHRFLGRAKVAIKNAADYEGVLRKNFVMVRAAERKKRIEGELARAVARQALKIREDAGLLETVTYLNEYPSVILGSFDEAFLDLPQEILVTVMRGHQKYFALEKRNGELAPQFAAVINLDRDPKGLVRAGHERVLRARFSDARFFWEADQKRPLGEYLPRLKQVTYQSKLGSYFDKVERMRAISRWLAEQWFAAGVTKASPADADRAAELSKCDLLTEMVGEFPELQGIVGGLYALAQGEADEIARAVYDHYRPTGIDDEIPGNLTGCTIALADKIDAIAGCLAVGLMPTGSSDPFGLRRAALGVVKIILEAELKVSIPALLEAAARSYATSHPKIQVTVEIQKQAHEFILERARFFMRERLGFAYDEVNAALAAGAEDLVDAVRRLEAIKAIRKTKNFEPLAVSFKRIRKIIEKAGPRTDWQMNSVDESLFEQAAERSLYKDANAVAKAVEGHKRAVRYRDALMNISELRPTVDRFFDEVLVMAENEPVRKNRLTLLSELLSQFSTIADFSEIVTASEAKAAS